MYVLVTGATGFVGFHTVMALLEAGHRVRLSVRSEEKMRRLYKPHNVDTSDYVVGEVTDVATVEASLKGVDAVVHTAAIVELNPKNQHYMQHVNVKGTELVLGCATRYGIKSMVYVSSIVALYDRHQALLTEALPLATGTKGYTQTKVESERIVEKLQAKGAPIAITYPTMIAGPDDPGMSEGNDCIKQILEGGSLITTSGQQIVDVRDLAKAHVLLVEHRKSGRYIAAGTFLPHRELADLLSETTGQMIKKRYIPRFVLRILGHCFDLAKKFFDAELPLTRQTVTYLTEWVPADDSKLSEELGLKNRPVTETLSDTLKWMVKAGHIDARFARQPNKPVS